MPVFNEAAIIEESLDRVLRLTGDFEVVVVDGGSSDRTVELAAGRARVIQCAKGRGTQMNAGAEATRGDVLLFLHADTILPDTAVRDIELAMNDQNVVGGAFSKRYDSDHFLLRPARYYTWTNFHIFGLISGDQGIFVRRDAFLRVGGFPDTPLMEEFELTRKLRRLGRLNFIASEAIVSSRRFIKNGVARTYLRMLRCIVLYRLGTPPEKIAGIYKDIR